MKHVYLFEENHFLRVIDEQLLIGIKRGHICALTERLNLRLLDRQGNAHAIPKRVEMMMNLCVRVLRDPT